MKNKSTPKWREKDGIIYFSVTSDGLTGLEWITRLKRRRFRVGVDAQNILRSPEFRATSGITTDVAVLKGSLFENNSRFIRNIRAMAKKHRLGRPKAELACLIREKLTDQELTDMGLWQIVVMHKPIKEILLGVSRDDNGRRLNPYCADFDFRWSHDHGFAFVVS